MATHSTTSSRRRRRGLITGKLLVRGNIYADHRARALDSLSPALTTLAAQTRRPPTDTPASDLFTHLSMPGRVPSRPTRRCPALSHRYPQSQRGPQSRERSQRPLAADADPAC